MMPLSRYRFVDGRRWRIILLVVAMLGLSACRLSPQPPAPAPAATVETSPTAVPPTPTAEPVVPVQTPATPAYTVRSSEPLSEDEAAPPANLRIPESGLEALVSPMGWQIVEVDGRRTTRWLVPENSAGWHPNSARAGQLGNVVISGHQLLGSAVFAPLATGEVTVGQDVLLTDTEDRTFVYRVVEVTEPLPISADVEAEEALAGQYMSPTTTSRLTLITGWPDFTTTHRVIVVAEFVGVVQ